MLVVIAHACAVEQIDVVFVVVGVDGSVDHDHHELRHLLLGHRGFYALSGAVAVGQGTFGGVARVGLADFFGFLRIKYFTLKAANLMPYSMFLLAFLASAKGSKSTGPQTAASL